MSTISDHYSHALSVDIGGAFTDYSLLDLRSGEVAINKVLTDPHNPERTLIEGAIQLLQATGVRFDQLQVVIHSTTLDTNALIERKGAKTALLTTRGFRDVLEMGRERMYHMYDLQAQSPEPIVPRYLRREVGERTTRDGTVVEALDPAEAVAVVQELMEEGIQGLAVSLLHSYKNPEPEQALKAAIQSKFPDLTVSLSSEVAPVINEYERTSTTVADCYIKPGMNRYMKQLEGMLAGAGYGGVPLIMHSAGGVMGSEKACQHPVRLLESGPAAGALAAGFYGGLLGQPDLISLDMGGTTAKTCLIDNGTPSLTNSIEVARIHRFMKGSGLPIAIPVVDLIEIGAGGGSIAWVDRLGLLKVGPQSAGADPGPACYDRGGDQPTVTDADLMLGYLDPEYFLGGKMKLDPDAAERAVSKLAETIDIEPVEAAAGIYSVVTENMAASARIHIIGRNKDPRNYAIMAFGGAGPTHACDVARTLGVTRVIVPLGAGVTSAVGCLAAPLSFEEVRSLPALLDGTDWVAVNKVVSQMRESSVAMLQETGLSLGNVETVTSADMRLIGQIHEINVPVPDGVLDASRIPELEDAFHRIYQSLYSRRNLSIPIQVQNWRVLVRVPQLQVRLRRETDARNPDPRPALKGTRRVYFHSVQGYLNCEVYDRYRLKPGHLIDGPAFVEERESTAVLSPRDRANVDEWLNLAIDVG